MCAISACVIAGMSDNVLFHALDSISFSMFCLHGAKAKDMTPRFGTLRKWRHPQCESGLLYVTLNGFSAGDHHFRLVGVSTMFPGTYVPRYLCSPNLCSPVPMFPGTDMFPEPM